MKLAKQYDVNVIIFCKIFTPLLKIKGLMRLEIISAYLQVRKNRSNK